MASMDDLIATMSSGLQAGQHGRDLQDLHVRLSPEHTASLPSLASLVPENHWKLTTRPS